MTGSGYWTVTMPQAPSPTSVPSSSTNLSWKEQILNRESQRLAAQKSKTLQLYERNRKDDSYPWLKYTKWMELFKGKDLQVIF
jgi:hypothetical protein